MNTSRKRFRGETQPYFRPPSTFFVSPVPSIVRGESFRAGGFYKMTDLSVREISLFFRIDLLFDKMTGFGK